MLTEELFLKLDKKFEKKNSIAEVAFKLFLSDGYIPTKIIDIAKAAGIGKGTVYEYFDSKESLLLFLIDTRVSREYAALMDKVVKAKPEEGQSITEAKLRTFLRVEYEFISKYGRYIDDIKLQFFEAGNEIAEKIMHSIFHIVHMQFVLVTGIVEEGIASGNFRQVNSKMAATCICSCVSSYLTAALGLSAPKDAPPEVTEIMGDLAYDEDELISILLTGIKA